MSSKPEIILFTYDISVYGRKLDWYLTFRGLKYSRCITRNRMPREQLEELGINYRRIPIMAIGKDVYCDTRLMIHKLEELFPENRLGAQNPFDSAIEYLLEHYFNDGGPFHRTATLIPPTAEVVNDPEWIKDRSSMSGRNFSKEMLAVVRPDGLAHSRMYFDFADKKLMADGRKFVLNTSQPTLADIQGQSICSSPLLQCCLQTSSKLSISFASTWALILLQNTSACYSVLPQRFFSLVIS
jgi:glutathione S-transferase